MTTREETIIMCVEPSKELSELCGFPYYIERRFTVKELLEQKIIDENDLSEMAKGKQISKSFPIQRSK